MRHVTEDSEQNDECANHAETARTDRHLTSTFPECADFRPAVGLYVNLPSDAYLGLNSNRKLQKLSILSLIMFQYHFRNIWPTIMIV